MKRNSDNISSTSLKETIEKFIRARALISIYQRKNVRVRDLRANQVKNETMTLRIQDLEHSLQAHQDQVDELVRAFEKQEQEWLQVVNHAHQNYQDHHRHLT